MARWQLKPGVGPHYHKIPSGKTVRVLEGGIIDCSVDAMGAFADKFVMIAPDPPSGAEPFDENRVVRVRIIPAEDGGIDVIHGTTGEKLNDVPISDKEARKLQEASGASE